MRKLHYFIALLLFASSVSFAQNSPLYTDMGFVNNTNLGNPNVGIGLFMPVFKLDLVAPVGVQGVQFDADNFLFGNANNASFGFGSNYNGAFGQSNSIIGNSNTSFTHGFMNTINNSRASFAAGSDNQISNSMGQGGDIALGWQNTIDNSEHSAAIGEENQIDNGHGSISLGGHNRNNGPYTMTLGSGLVNNMANTLMAGFGTPTFFIGNNMVGIGTTNPQSLLHAAGAIRSDNLLGGGNVCADANGNLILSGPCSAPPPPGISNSCTNINFVPKGIDPLGNLGCSQIFDNGASVGINTTGPFNYTWAGGLTGPILPPPAGIVRLDVNGVVRGLAYIATSDASLKTKIEKIRDAGSILQKLSGKTYHWNEATLDLTGAADIKQYGFIAQEVAEVLPEAVSIDENGLYGINYTSFIPLLTEAVKEQQLRIEGKDAEIAGLQSQLNAIMNEFSQMRNEMESLRGALQNNGGTGTGATGNGSYLEQNNPNPFSQSTTIRFHLAQEVKTAVIYIHNLKGKQEASYPVQPGQNHVVVQQGSLQPGTYVYSLVTDGKVVDTKQMIVSD